jgi:hypothetical protein
VQRIAGKAGNFGLTLPMWSRRAVRCLRNKRACRRVGLAPPAERGRGRRPLQTGVGRGSLGAMHGSSLHAEATTQSTTASKRDRWRA